MIDYVNLARVVKRSLDAAYRGERHFELIGETLDSPEEQIRELGWERDAARREVAELRAAASAYHDLTERHVRKYPYHFGEDEDGSQATLLDTEEKLRALLAPPPERAGEGEQ